MSWIGSAVRGAGDSDRLLVASLGVLCAEVTIRVGVAWQTTPLWAILLPPVLTVVALGLAGTYRRQDGPDSVGSPTYRGWRLAGVLTLIAVTGHAVAVVLGTSLFLLLDTPLRAGLYWLGVEPLARPVLALGWPLLGVAVGVVVAWTVPTLVVASVAAGASLGRAVRQTLAAVVSAPRTVAPVAGTHVLLAASVVVASVTGYAFGVVTNLVWLFVAVTGTLTAVFATLPLAMVALTGIGTVSRRLATSPGAETEHSSLEPRRRAPVFRVMIACLLIVSLATVAGSVRVLELRPTDTSPEPLGEDPQKMYRTAIENTYQQSYSVELVVFSGTENETYGWHYIQDRSDRQLLIRNLSWNNSAYFSPSIASEKNDEGFGAEGQFFRDAVLSERTRGDGENVWIPGVDGILVAPVDYFDPHEDVMADGSVPEFERTGAGDSIVLESNRPADVLPMNGIESSRLNESRTLRLRVTIDPETRTVTSIDTRIVATLDGFTGVEQTVDYDSRARFDFDLDADVERPAFVGSPSVEERIWQLLVY